MVSIFNHVYYKPNSILLFFYEYIIKLIYIICFYIAIEILYGNLLNDFLLHLRLHKNQIAIILWEPIEQQIDDDAILVEVYWNTDIEESSQLYNR